MPKRPDRGGRAVFYTRDSGGKHDTTPGQYVEWAMREAVTRGLQFSGTAAIIEGMIRTGESHAGDIYLDYDVCGNQLTRPGLDALFSDVERDSNVTHVLIPRRDRLARPDEALDGVLLELRLRKLGVHIVYSDRTCESIRPGQRQRLEDLLVSAIDFDQAGKDRRVLAEKLIYSQAALARGGFSFGGRPPYGFARWLARVDGAAVTPVRQLLDGERVRMAGHHVVWLPADDGTFEIALRIREMLLTMPASQIARRLTADGIPSPDAGRRRTDGGVKHETSGLWQSTSITNIGRSPLFASIMESGRRSMGDQLRFTPEGPREMTEADYRRDGKPKVVSNPAEHRVTAPAHFEPAASLEEHHKLQEILDVRAGTQRGKARSRDPLKNPLGGRIHDLNCGWPMYRAPYNGSFRYVCAYYTQAHGDRCSHNHVDGPTAARFVLAATRQYFAWPDLQAKLEARLRELALADHAVDTREQECERLRQELAVAEKDKGTIQRNLARAKSDGEYNAVAAEFEGLLDKIKKLEQLLAAETAKPAAGSVDVEVAAAMAVLDRLPDLAADENNLASITQAFGLVNARLYLAFQPVQEGKRTLNKISAGMLTFGATPPPIMLYEGPTGRRALATQTTAALSAAVAEGNGSLPRQFDTDREGYSLGNVNRGDRI